MDDDRALGELTAKVEALQAAFVDFRDETRKEMRRSTAELKAMIVQASGHERLNDHSRRLGNLERWRSGIVAVISATPVIGGAVAWLLGIVGGGGQGR